jgi:hypothetical protein
MGVRVRKCVVYGMPAESTFQEKPYEETQDFRSDG